MNDYYLKSRRPGKYDTPFYRRAAAAHELGHALGLCHKSAVYGSSIMVKTADDIPSIKPTSRDRGDYHKIWG
jgi:predicted Zn-dependent protease